MATPQIIPYATASYQGRSSCGVASFVLAVLTLCWELAAVALLWYAGQPGVTNSLNSVGTFCIVIGGIALLAGGLPALVGTILGLLAFRRRFGKRALSIAGLAINLVILLAVAFLILQGLIARH